MHAQRFRVLAPIAVILLSAGIYALLHLSRPEPEQSDKGPRGAAVRVAVATESSGTLEVLTHGEVRPRVEIDLVSEVGGRVTAVSPQFVLGGTVEPGALLLQIDDTDYQLALREARARVADAELAVQQALADQDVARKQLRNSRDASDLALKKPQVAQARAMLEAAGAGVAQAQLNLERTAVSLPFSGRITQTYVQVGQFISPGTALARVFGTDLVEVRLPLTNAQLAMLDLPIGHTAPAGGGLEVSFSARVGGTQHHWHGKLVRIDPSVDPDTRLLYATAEVDDPYGAAVSMDGMPLAVGLFVEARIEGSKRVHALQIPAKALRAGDLVYVVNDEGLLEIRDVKVATSNASLAVIHSGLEAGERVVVSALRNPIAGMLLSTISDDMEG